MVTISGSFTMPGMNLPTSGIRALVVGHVFWSSVMEKFQTWLKHGRHVNCPDQ
jgi:hypothetical protein